MTTRKLSRFALVLVLVPVLAIAQFSIGPVITFDPTAVAKILKETLEVVKVASATLATYNQLMWDAKFIGQKYFWRGFFVNAVYEAIPDQVGETDPWALAAMKGLGTVNAWSRGAIALQSNPRLILGNPFTAQYASAEIGAASARGALSVLGNSRVAMMQMQAPIQDCETNTLSGDKSLNTSAAQQNISNACQSLLLRQSQTQLAVDTARLDLELARTKMAVDNQTEFANTVTAIQNYTATQAVAPADVAAGLREHVDP